MASSTFSALLARQQAYFRSGATRPLAFRIEQLQKLRAAVKSAESELLAAMHADMRKPQFEAYASEIGFLYREIDHAIHGLPTWAEPQKVPGAANVPDESCYVYAQPKGIVLIIGPWNYPLNLLLSPVIGALAAGNCVVVKPSEVALHTGKAIADLLAKTLPSELCTAVLGGVETTTELLKESFAHIFFTGSVPVGRIVMRAAAETLSPVTLELGGKSPCLVEASSDLAITAQRITWGKFYNAGQTCVAPDYLLVPKDLQKALVAAIARQIEHAFGRNPQTSPDFARIINTRHFDRLQSLISGNVVVGGTGDRQSLYMAPTVIDDVSMNDKVMAEEIFGPILPVLAYDSLDHALALIAQRPNPLALYLFTQKPEIETRVRESVAFGGGCINHTLMHLSNPGMPFGGIGDSGIGAYHGQDSFTTFSHKQSILRASQSAETPFRYPPYGERLSELRQVLK